MAGLKWKPLTIQTMAMAMTSEDGRRLWIVYNPVNEKSYSGKFREFSQGQLILTNGNVDRRIDCKLHLSMRFTILEDLPEPEVHAADDALPLR